MRRSQCSGERSEPLKDCDPATGASEVEGGIGRKLKGGVIHRQDAKSAKKDWEKMLQSGTGKRSTLKDASEEFTGEELMNAFLMR
jgi:hypothetical protein